MKIGILTKVNDSLERVSNFATPSENEPASHPGYYIFLVQCAL